MQNAPSDQSLVTASSADGKSGRLPFVPNLPTPPSTTTTTVVAKSQNPQQQQVVAHRDSSGGALTKRTSLVHSSRFICEKCGCTEYHTGEVRSPSGLWTKIFNVDNNRFHTLTCSGCGFTQMFKTQQSMLANLIDLVIR